MSDFQCINIQEAAIRTRRLIASYTGLQKKVAPGERYENKIMVADPALDILPVEQRQRPLQAGNFHEADPGSNWLPLLSSE